MTTAIQNDEQATPVDGVNHVIAGAFGVALTPKRKRTRRTTPMECLECGRKFRRTIGPRTYEVQCPGCGGYDTDVR